MDPAGMFGLDPNTSDRVGVPYTDRQIQEPYKYDHAQPPLPANEQRGVENSHKSCPTPFFSDVFKDYLK